jgi:hypothetical protein
VRGRAAVLGRPVAREGELAVGARWHEPPAPLARERPAGQEGADRRTAPVPARPRRHRDRGVVGKQGEDGVDVGLLPGLDEALGDLSDALVPERAERLLLAALGQPLVHRAVGALQDAVDGVGRGVEGLAHLAGREPEHVAQDEHGALARREVLERRDECELDALALLVARIGRLGVGLEPGDLGGPLGRSFTRS